MPIFDVIVFDVVSDTRTSHVNTRNVAHSGAVRSFVNIERISALFLTPSATLQRFEASFRAFATVPLFRCSVGTTKPG